MPSRPPSPKLENRCRGVTPGCRRGAEASPQEKPLGFTGNADPLIPAVKATAVDGPFPSPFALPCTCSPGSQQAS